LNFIKIKRNNSYFINAQSIMSVISFSKVATVLCVCVLLTVTAVANTLGKKVSAVHIKTTIIEHQSSVNGVWYSKNLQPNEACFSRILITNEETGETITSNPRLTKVNILVSTAQECLAFEPAQKENIELEVADKL
jgi:hypothetical protein